MLKKLPALLLSPVLAALFATLLYNDAVPRVVSYCTSSLPILLMCTLWTKWAWRLNIWQAFAAVCQSGVLQVALTCLSSILFALPVLEENLQLALAAAIYITTALGIAALLRRLRFGAWFRRLLEDAPGQRRIALLLFALEAAMEAFYILRKGILPDYLIPYYLLVIVLAALTVGLVIYLAQRLEAAQKVEAQRDVIAQQQLYERELESIRQEIRTFRHDYKNLLSGLSEQAKKGQTDSLCAALSQLDAGFDRRVGEKIQASTQIGNLRIPQVRSLLLSKLAALGDAGVDCRLEVLYPVEQVAMDHWDFVRCLGILLDNAAEAALETQSPWVEIVLLALGDNLSLRVSNPCGKAIDPDMLWREGCSTKGAGRGVGLSSYQRILAGCPNATASTSWAEGIFVQELTVEAVP